jgi:hypothetical protein
MALIHEAHLVELRRLRLALTEISALLEAIERRPQLLLRHAADALEDSLIAAHETRSEDRFVRQFAFAITSHRMHNAGL